MSTLYVVGTPIGNLEDITLRALRILKEVDVILCEDTRETKKLLSRYDITKPTISYHTHSKLSKVDHILKLLEEGKNLALVSDAGTPGISDPGSYLVLKIKEAFGDEVTVVPIAGPNAAIAALSASGFSASDFLFLGFLPHKKGRETLFSEIVASERSVVFYESPHRILKTLVRLKELLRESRTVVIGREISKVYESFIRGSASEVLEHFTSHPDQVRGEFVVIVEGGR